MIILLGFKLKNFDFHDTKVGHFSIQLGEN